VHDIKPQGRVKHLLAMFSLYVGYKIINSENPKVGAALSKVKQKLPTNCSIPKLHLIFFLKKFCYERKPSGEGGSGVTPLVSFEA
jgi:hypothetical protein